jgi:hypothetical protein
VQTTCSLDTVAQGYGGVTADCFTPARHDAVVEHRNRGKRGVVQTSVRRERQVRDCHDGERRASRGPTLDVRAEALGGEVPGE